MGHQAVASGASPSVITYELRIPTSYQSQFNPVRIVGPDGSVVATEDDLIELTGDVAASYGSFSMIGPVLLATDIRAAP
jgi:hypothetical protein